MHNTMGEERGGELRLIGGLWESLEIRKIIFM